MSNGGMKDRMLGYYTPPHLWGTLDSDDSYRVLVKKPRIRDQERNTFIAIMALP